MSEKYDILSDRELRIIRAALIKERSRVYEHNLGINIVYEGQVHEGTNEVYSHYMAELNTIIMKIEKELELRHVKFI